jgi:hypothetical protein
MKTYKKNYIGKGTQVPNMSIAKCTVKVSERSSLHLNTGKGIDRTAKHLENSDWSVRAWVFKRHSFI